VQESRLLLAGNRDRFDTPEYTLTGTAERRMPALLDESFVVHYQEIARGNAPAKHGQFFLPQKENFPLHFADENLLVLSGKEKSLPAVHTWPGPGLIPGPCPGPVPADGSGAEMWNSP
jgi:hypothetical protein